ncbi:endonuclease domain-containing protein [Desulfobacca acetoxidans]
MRGERLYTQIARHLRKNSTDAERLLWFNLRNRRLGAYKFRRQYNVGPFIVDFVCLEKKLIIELDGGQHAEMIEEDMKRTEFLLGRGYTVLRFWDNEVLKETESVLQVILSRLTNAKTPSP